MLFEWILYHLHILRYKYDQFSLFLLTLKYMCRFTAHVRYSLNLKYRLSNLFDTTNYPGYAVYMPIDHDCKQYIEVYYETATNAVQPRLVLFSALDMKRADISTK